MKALDLKASEKMANLNFPNSFEVYIRFVETTK